MVLLLSYTKQPGEELVLTKDMKDAFDKDGYILIRKLFSEKNISMLKSIVADPDSPLMKNAYDHGPGGKSGKVKMVRWNQPGNDVTGHMARCNSIVNACEELLEGEVYHYHTRLILKEAFTGGTFQWHQDYGYWYANGILAPNMLSVMISIDAANKENGCLQIIPRTHKLGRIDHKKYENDAGADTKRVEEILKKYNKCYVETEPGDVLFFHCNLLHRSDSNKSENRRGNLTVCYNRDNNEGFCKHHHSSYVRIKKVADASVENCKKTDDVSDKEFYTPAHTFGQKLETK